MVKPKGSVCFGVCWGLSSEFNRSSLDHRSCSYAIVYIDLPTLEESLGRIVMLKSLHAMRIRSQKREGFMEDLCDQSDASKCGGLSRLRKKHSIV